MRRRERLERLIRVRRAERDRARREREHTERAASLSRDRAEAERDRLGAQLQDLDATTGAGAFARWWRAAHLGLAERADALRSARDEAARAEAEDAAALRRLLEARYRLDGLERLAERARQERERERERSLQREIDERGARRRTRRLVAGSLLALALSVAAPTSSRAETSEKESTPDFGVARLLQEIRARGSALDAREREIEDRERHLRGLEEIVEARLAELEQLADAVEERIASWENAHEDKSLSRLAKIYGTMDPRRAAPLLERLELDLATRIVAKMKHKQSAALLPLVSQPRALEMSRRVAHPLGAPGRERKQEENP